MVRAVVKDVIFLGQKSADAAPSDVGVGDDLLDTLRANAEHCVGMAANMIGVKKRIIAFQSGDTYTVMFNPEIIKRAGAYHTEEGCLSLSGTRSATRYEMISVRYADRDFHQHTDMFTGWTAQIIQHEIDHCAGILI